MSVPQTISPLNVQMNDTKVGSLKEQLKVTNLQEYFVTRRETIETFADWLRHQLLTFNVANVALLVAILIVSANVKVILEQQQTTLRSQELANSAANQLISDLTLKQSTVVKAVDSILGSVNSTMVEITAQNKLFLINGFQNFSKFAIQHSGDRHPPAVYFLTPGNGVFTTPSGAVYLRVRAVGAGGGGSGSGPVNGNLATSGSRGGSTYFDNLISASGGMGGKMESGSNGAAGGTASLTTSVTTRVNGTAIAGGMGASAGGYATVNGLFVVGGVGGSSAFGGGGAGGINTPGSDAPSYTGAGGGGGGTANLASLGGGPGGGAGGSADVILFPLRKTYGWAIGSGGAGGSADVSGYSGGIGGSGMIEITAYFN